MPIMYSGQHLILAANKNREYRITSGMEICLEIPREIVSLGTPKFANDELINTYPIMDNNAIVVKG